MDKLEHSELGEEHSREREQRGWSRGLFSLAGAQVGGGGQREQVVGLAGAGVVQGRGICLTPPL